MNRAERLANLAGVVVPFAGVLAAIILLWNSWVDVTDLAILAVMYFATGLGVTIGFHRLLTHRSFRTTPWLEHTFAGLGQLSVQGSVMDWVADHRKHHAHTDQEGDPHSPHVGHGSGIRGLWHAHTGWLLETSLLIPTLLGFALHGFTWQGALRGYIWGGLVRIFLLHHITWSVNSICHYFGTRRFDVEDKSTNVAWLAIPSLGESWHHNHHAFPRSAKHGLRRREVDVSALVISGLARVGLAHDIVTITPERQAQKQVQPDRERERELVKL
jgi:stearoyl-CoA desaturase (delta-9 desaturase)